MQLTGQAAALLDEGHLQLPSVLATEELLAGVLVPAAAGQCRPTQHRHQIDRQRHQGIDHVQLPQHRGLPQDGDRRVAQGQCGQERRRSAQRKPHPHAEGHHELAVAAGDVSCRKQQQCHRLRRPHQRLADQGATAPQHKRQSLGRKRNSRRGEPRPKVCRHRATREKHRRWLDHRESEGQQHIVAPDRDRAGGIGQAHGCIVIDGHRPRRPPVTVRAWVPGRCRPRPTRPVPPVPPGEWPTW